MRLASVLLYLVVEIGVFVAMSLTLGFWWAVLITLGAAMLGFVLLRRQGAKVFGELRRASRNEVDPTTPLADTALLAGSTFLLVVPGIVTTLAGIALLAPPTRKIMRPAVAAFGARRVVTAMDRAGVYASTGFRRGTVIDGTVIDGDVVNGDLVDPAGNPATTHDSRELPRGH